MELTYIIIAAGILVLTGMLWSSSPDTKIVLGAEPYRKPARTARAVKMLQQSSRAQPQPTARKRLARGTAERVRQLAKGGRKIEAIKLLHEQTGMSLQQAKNLVDRLG